MQTNDSEANLGMADDDRIWWRIVLGCDSYLRLGNGELLRDFSARWEDACEEFGKALGGNSECSAAGVGTICSDDSLAACANVSLAACISSPNLRIASCSSRLMGVPSFCEDEGVSPYCMHAVGLLLGIARDQKNQLHELIRAGLQSDLLLLTSGVSIMGHFRFDHL